MGAEGRTFWMKTGLSKRHRQYTSLELKGKCDVIFANIEA